MVWFLTLARSHSHVEGGHACASRTHSQEQIDHLSLCATIRPSRITSGHGNVLPFVCKAVIFIKSNEKTKKIIRPPSPPSPPPPVLFHSMQSFMKHQWNNEMKTKMWKTFHQLTDSGDFGVICIGDIYLAPMSPHIHMHALWTALLLSSFVALILCDNSARS